MATARASRIVRLEDGRLNETVAVDCDRFWLAWLPELNTTVEVNGRILRVDMDNGIVLERLKRNMVVEYWPRQEEP